MESEGARLALVEDASITIDEVEAIGPSGICLFGDVFESINHGRKLDTEFADATVGDGSALFHVARAGEHDIVFHVALHLPDITRMRFEDVHGVEGDVVSVLLVK